MLHRRPASRAFALTSFGLLWGGAVLNGCYDNTNLLGSVAVGGQRFVTEFGGASAGGASTGGASTGGASAGGASTGGAIGTGRTHFMIDVLCLTDGSQLTLSKDCSLDSDCTEVRSTEDLRIGNADPANIAVVAINANELQRFEQYARLCPGKVGGSEPPPIETEDGKTAPAGTDVTITCASGRCQTSLP